MSYAAYFKTMQMPVPKGLGVALGLYAYINVFNGKPSLWTREISKSEFNATPMIYLQNPDHHHVACPKVPGQAHVPDALGELHHKAHAKPHH
mmetsp:Transcript_25542/g.69328  ORF Transcript_25542/g.69328 Transcript_25542/m.69328 type:complete len:92 (+) Transcript_25542:51-326(+)